MIFSDFHDDSVSSLAHWVEFNAVCGKQIVSSSTLANQLERADFRYEESRIESVFWELERRVALYGENAPFTIQEQVVEPSITWSEFPEYAMCLYFSLFGASKQPVGTKLFEQTSNEAVREYIYGESRIIGFPAAQSLANQIKELAEYIHEQYDITEIGRNEKDSGVDIIAWKSFNDSRSSQTIFLLQCAAGYDWRDKKQITDSWNYYIKRLVPFTKGLITSDIVAASEWGKQCRTFHLIFDRARLYRLWQKATINDAVRSSVLEWCNTFIPQQIGE